LALCEESALQSGLSGTPTLPEFGDVDADATWIWAWESDADHEPHALHDLSDTR